MHLIAGYFVEQKLFTLCRSELLHIAYRKPEWDWARDIARASPVPVPASEGADTRLADLLPREWIDKLAQGPSASSKSFGANANYSIGLRGVVHGSHAASAGAAAATVGGMQSQQYAPEHLQQHQHPVIIDSYYPGHIPGFVVGCTSDMMEECFNK
jgi:hypothetical protein